MPTAKPLSEQDLAFVSDTASALLQDTPRGARLLLWSIVLFLACALTWAWFAQLEEVTIGQGKVIPSRQLQVVQNLEGGILDEIYVKEGDQVVTGQALSGWMIPSFVPASGRINTPVPIYRLWLPGWKMSCIC